MSIIPRMIDSIDCSLPIFVHFGLWAFVLLILSHLVTIFFTNHAWASSVIKSIHRGYTANNTTSLSLMTMEQGQGELALSTKHVCIGNWRLWWYLIWGCLAMAKDPRNQKAQIISRQNNIWQSTMQPFWIKIIKMPPIIIIIGNVVSFLSIIDDIMDHEWKLISLFNSRV